MDCSTVGEARQLEPTLSCTYLPGSDFEDEEGNPLPDDAPYNWRQTGEAEAGEWPPLSDGYSYGYGELPLELLQGLTTSAGGHLVHTMSGSSFAVPLERETDLVTVVRRSGYEVRRDDGLLGSLSGVSYQPNDGLTPRAPRRWTGSCRAVRRREWPGQPSLRRISTTGAKLSTREASTGASWEGVNGYRTLDRKSLVRACSTPSTDRCADGPVSTIRPCSMNTNRSHTSRANPIS
jgi:hypothetical protein